MFDLLKETIIGPNPDPSGTFSLFTVRTIIFWG